MSSLQRRLIEPQASIIPPWFGKVIAVRASCDTAIGMTREHNQNITGPLRDMGAHLIIKQNPYCWKYHLTRPELEHFDPLDAWALFKNHFAIAFDFKLEEGWWAEQCRKWLANHANLNWKNCTKRWAFGRRPTKRNPDTGNKGCGAGTLYWEDTTLRAGLPTPARSMKLYENWRLTNVIRLELSFQCTGAVRANGLDDWSLEGLRAINPRAVMQKHLKLTDVNEVWVQGHRKIARHRDWPKWKLDELCECVRGRALVTNGFTMLAPTQQPMEQGVVDAFMAMLPERLSW